MKDNDDLARSGLAFGWIEETRPRSGARRYWIAIAMLLAGVVATVVVLASI
ncbi:MAG: hypothetical protein ACK5PW_19290 [Burkholderiales bacterium]